MLFKSIIVCAAWFACVHCQQGPTTTPVPILKQINRQNDDGSYSYGYEAADGSFKIETKYPSGDVAGKYGYVDESGNLREISYGASSKRGFEPQGQGIMVPPPTLHDPSNALTDGQEDDGQYREDPKIYEDPKYNGRAQSRPATNFRQFHQPAQLESQYQPEPQYQSQYRQAAPTYQQTQPAATYQQTQPAATYQQTQPAATYQQSQPATTYQQRQPVQQPQTSQFRSSLYTQQSNLFNQAPQQFPQERPQSQVYHQQPQFSYQAFTPQPHNQYQSQNEASNYQPSYQGQNYNPFSGHPAQNIDPSTGSYTINFTGK